MPASSAPQRHINFFEDLDQGNKLGGQNIGHEQEKRLEKRKRGKSSWATDLDDLEIS